MFARVLHNSLCVRAQVTAILSLQLFVTTSIVHVFTDVNVISQHFRTHPWVVLPIMCVCASLFSLNFIILGLNKLRMIK